MNIRINSHLRMKEMGLKFNLLKLYLRTLNYDKRKYVFNRICCCYMYMPMCIFKKVFKTCPNGCVQKIRTLLATDLNLLQAKHSGKISKADEVQFSVVYQFNLNFIGHLGTIFC